jgi:uncharacterized protein
MVGRRQVLICLVSSLGAALPGCRAEDSYPGGALRIATGGVGGVYYAYGMGLASVIRWRLPRLRPEVLQTAASVENLSLLRTGQAQLAFSLADTAAEALAGQAPFGAPLKLAALARLYDNYLHLVTRTDNGIQALPDLAGRRVSIGAAGSGTELTTQRMLAASGLRVEPVRLAVEASADALARKDIEAFFFSAGLPAQAISELASTLPIRLVALDGAVTALRRRYGEIYTERTIPISVYGLVQPVATIGVPNYLVVGEQFDDSIAYRLTRLLFAERDRLASAHPEVWRLDRRVAIDTYPLPLHPGAVRYYREAKLAVA